MILNRPNPNFTSSLFPPKITFFPTEKTVFSLPHIPSYSAIFIFTNLTSVSLFTERHMSQPRVRVSRIQTVDFSVFVACIYYSNGSKPLFSQVTNTLPPLSKYLRTPASNENSHFFPSTHAFNVPEDSHLQYGESSHAYKATEWWVRMSGARPTCLYGVV
jgi:hypothetical protein